MQLVQFKTLGECFFFYLSYGGRQRDVACLLTSVQSSFPDRRHFVVLNLFRYLQKYIVTLAYVYGLEFIRYYV